MITDIVINPENKKRWYEEGWWTNETMHLAWMRQMFKGQNREYVSDDLGTRYTFKEIDKRARRLASWLASVGVENGDVVSFQMPPWAEFCVIYVACTWVGAVIHPLSTAFNGGDLVYCMNLVGSKAYLAPTFNHKTNHEEQILGVVDQIPTLSRDAIAVCDRLAPAKECITIDEIVERYITYPYGCPAKADDVALILSTSGTTGRPKQVLYTHNTLIAAERTFNEGLHLGPDDVMFMPAPLSHATGFNHGLIAPLIQGGRVVLQHKFDAKEALKIIKKEGVTWSMGATPFITELLEASDETGLSLEPLELYVCGGAPVPKELIKRAADHGVLLCEDYGSTESSPHVFVPREKCLEWNGDWSGIPYEGIEVKVVDSRGNEVPRGVQGEEISRGPNVFVGYLNNPEATARDLSEDGWFHSGDLCIMDEQGRIKINGRKKEIIIRGGENISCIEVDEHVKKCPLVADCATVGMKDERMGERIATFVVPANNGQTPTKDDIVEFLENDGVAKRLWPEHIELIDSIPMTETGKIRRNQLAKELEDRL